MTIDTVGAAVFGVVVGYITYRTLIRSVHKSAIGDLAAVIAAIGGGAVAKQYNDSEHLFAWYAIGVGVGMAFFWLVFRLMNGKEKTASVMRQDDTDASGGIRPSA